MPFLFLLFLSLQFLQTDSFYIRRCKNCGSTSPLDVKYYHSTKYPLKLLGTTNLETRASFIKELVNKYRHGSTDWIGNMHMYFMNRDLKISFDHLPSQEYEPVTIHDNSKSISPSVYNSLFYIGHESLYKENWLTAKDVYYYARLECILTEDVTNCTVSYNEVPGHIWKYCLLGAFCFIVLIASCIPCMEHIRKQQRQAAQARIAYYNRLRTDTRVADRVESDPKVPERPRSPHSPPPLYQDCAPPSYEAL